MFYYESVDMSLWTSATWFKHFLEGHNNSIFIVNAKRT